MTNYYESVDLPEGYTHFVMHVDMSVVVMSCVLRHNGNVITYVSRKIKIQK